MNSRVIVVGVIEKDGKILLGRKPENIGPYPNTWHIPGGGMNLGEEMLDDAIRREVREEAGIEIENIEPIGFAEDKEPNKHGELTHYIFLSFKAQYKSGEVNANDDMAEIKWVDKSELKNMNLNRASQKLFTKLNLI